MEFLRRIIYDFERLPHHYDMVALFSIFFQRVLPLIGLGCLALGVLAAGYGFLDGAGNPHRGTRRVALAGAFSVLGIALYIVVPVWLDALGITPSQGHLRFYGMFFLPVGALAGVLAVMTGSWRRLAPPDGKALRARFSVAGYGIGFVVLWPLFYLYSALILGVTMIAAFTLIRATVTAALGALLFAAAPYLIHVVEPRPGKRLLAWAYGLVVAGIIALLVAQVTSLVLSLRADVL